jgi:hypothetical protein
LTYRDDADLPDLPVGMPVGAALPRDLDVAQVEKVEQEIDRFISVRHERRILKEGERKEMELWQRREKQHNAARRQQLLSDLLEFHRGQARRIEEVAAQIAAEHRAKAAEIEGMSA